MTGKIIIKISIFAVIGGRRSASVPSFFGKKNTLRGEDFDRCWECLVARPSSHRKAVIDHQYLQVKKKKEAML